MTPCPKTIHRILTVFCCIVSVSVVSCDVPFSRTPQQDYERGEGLFRAGKREAAFQCFAAASRKDPKNARFHWAAGSTAASRNDAFVHISAAWENGMKNERVLVALVQLSFQTDEKQRIGHALELYSQLPDSARTQEFRGDIFSMFGSLDSSLALWVLAFAAHPSPVLAGKIGSAYGRSGQPAKAVEFLLACKERGLLDARGYTLLGSTYAFVDDVARAESTFAEARFTGRYDASSLVSQAIAEMAFGKIMLAESLLAGVSVTTADSASRVTLLSARTLRAFLYGARVDTASLARLAREASGPSPVDKGERMFIEGILQLAKKDTTGREKIRIAQRVMPDVPAVHLLMARQYVSAGKPKEAIGEYRSLPALLVRSPVIAIEYADALARAGRDDDALALISLLHQRKMISKQSLTLFRDLALRKRLMDKAFFAQSMLEKRFGDDAQVRWSGAVMAFQSGKLDSALVLFDALVKSHPDEERFQRARIMVLLEQEKYDDVIGVCGARPTLADLKARALSKQGKEAEARETYRQALATAKTSQLLVEYANFLIGAGDNAEASKTLSLAIDSVGKRPGTADAGMAALLNNYAWTSLQSGVANMDDIIKAVEKANRLDPANPHILDTYAAVLLKAGKAKQCVALLDTCSPSLQTTGLLIALGKAGEQVKDNNKAIRAYRQAIARMDSAGVVDGSMSRADLESAVQRLSAGKQ